jgi:hypothetical protein
VKPVLLELPEQQWECLSCDLKQVTREARPHARMHPCKGMAGLTVPMVPAGTRGENRMVEREDYIGSEVVQLAPGTGRPVMSVTTTRDDGEDCTVYAPTATLNGAA